MNWYFPLDHYPFSVPEKDHPGAFLKERKFHFHEGVDLYTKPNAKVYAVEDSIVYKILKFTGEKAGSPWWNNTRAIVLKGNSGYILYGEVKIKKGLKEGDKILKGEHIATVKAVLKKRKHNPRYMLHFEWYDKFQEPIELIKNKRNRDKKNNIYEKVKENGLLDPTQNLKKSLFFSKVNTNVNFKKIIYFLKAKDFDKEILYNELINNLEEIKIKVFIVEKVKNYTKKKNSILISNSKVENVDLIINIKNNLILKSDRGTESYTDITIHKIISRILEF